MRSYKNWLRIKGSPDPILKGRTKPGILSFHADELPPGIPVQNNCPPGTVDRKWHSFSFTECCLILFPGAVEFGPVAAAKSCRTFPLLLHQRPKSHFLLQETESDESVSLQIRASHVTRSQGFFTFVSFFPGGWKIFCSPDLRKTPFDILRVWCVLL